MASRTATCMWVSLGTLRSRRVFGLLQDRLRQATLCASIRASVSERNPVLGFAFGDAKIIARVTNFIA